MASQIFMSKCGLKGELVANGLNADRLLTSKEMGDKKAVKPKVMIIIDSEIIGGPGRGLFLFLRSLKSWECEYVLSNFERRRRRSSEFVNYARQNGFNLELIKESFRFDPLMIVRASKLIKRHGCNLIETHGYKGHVIALVLSKLLGLPWIAVTHGWTNEDWKIRLYNHLELFLLKFPDAVVVVSPQLYKSVSLRRETAKSKKPTYLIPNAADAETLPGSEGGWAIRRRYGLTGQAALIGCFGRLSPEKGHRFLLQALAALAAELTEVHLLVAGDGPQRQVVEDLASKLALQSRVHFCGHHSSMRDLYEAIDLLVLPSLSEGLPNVVLEAMSMNVPVLATNVGALSEVIQDGANGWLVPPGDSEVLAAKLKEIFSNPSILKEVGTRARSSLFPKFSPETRSAAILKIYRETLGTPNNSG